MSQTIVSRMQLIGNADKSSPPNSAIIREIHSSSSNRRRSIDPTLEADQTVEVTGKDRSRYFKSPVLDEDEPTTPYEQWLHRMSQQIPERNRNMDGVVLRSTPSRTKRSNSNAKPEINLSSTDNTEESKTKTVEIQTDYRESEAQTDPYSPEYVITDGGNPEIVHLADMGMSYGT